MLHFTPYLHFNGNTEEVINYYKSILGGEITIMGRYKDIPGGEKMPPELQDKIIHASLVINERLTIMATDALEAMDRHLVEGNNFHICIHTESEPETNKLFEKLSKDGSIEMPLNKTFWGAYFGMCKDKYGIQWMFNYSYDR